MRFGRGTGAGGGEARIFFNHEWTQMDTKGFATASPRKEGEAGCSWDLTTRGGFRP